MTTIPTKGALIAVAAAVLALPGAALAADNPIYTYSGADRAQKILDGARKEGKVVVYSSMIVDQALRPIGDGFQARYPEVKFEFWRGDNREIVQKITVEKRASKQIADVVESSGVAGPLVAAATTQKFATPLAVHYAAQHIDPNGMYIASRLSYFGLAYNTKQVDAGLLPKTYKDLLDPKYKDKLSWRAQSESGADLFMTMILKTLGEKAGEDYLKALAKQNVVNYTGSARALVDRVGQGEYAMAINIFAHHPLISKEKGAPLDVQMMAPIPSIPNVVMAVKDAPHPHAAMLFIDYILSTEAQVILQKADYFPPHQDVAPDPKLAKILPKNAGMKEEVVSSEEVFEYGPRVQKLYEEFFK